MSDESYAGMIIEAVRNFEQLAIEEFKHRISYDFLAGFAPNYFDGPYETVIEKIDKDFPISSEACTDGLLKNVMSFTYRNSKTILDGNWREHIIYSYILILLDFQLANFPQYQGFLYWKSSMVLAVSAFLSHGSLVGRNFDALEDKRIHEVKNIFSKPNFSSSTLFKNMFSYKSDSEEFKLAKAIIVWNILLDIDLANLRHPNRLELGYLAYETSKRWRYFEELEPAYKATPILNTYGFENIISDLLSIKRKTTELLSHSFVQLADKDIQQEFLKPAMRVTRYFLNYPGEMSEMVGMKK